MLDLGTARLPQPRSRRRLSQVQHAPSVATIGAHDGRISHSEVVDEIAPDVTRARQAPDGQAIPGLVGAGAAFKFIPVEHDPFADEQTK